MAEEQSGGGGGATVVVERRMSGQGANTVMNTRNAIIMYIFYDLHYLHNRLILLYIFYCLPIVKTTKLGVIIHLHFCFFTIYIFTNYHIILSTFLKCGNPCNKNLHITLHHILHTKY